MCERWVASEHQRRGCKSAAAGLQKCSGGLHAKQGICCPCVSQFVLCINIREQLTGLGAVALYTPCHAGLRMPSRIMPTTSSLRA